MKETKLEESVSRWLTHQNYSFKSIKTKEDTFRVSIKHVGGLHWLEQEGPTDIVLIVGQDWSIIQDCPIQRHQMSTEF